MTIVTLLAESVRSDCASAGIDAHGASGVEASSRPSILQPTTSTSPVSWQQELKRAVRDPVELVSLLGLPDSIANDFLLAEANAASGEFGLFVPRPFLAQMRKGDVADPLLRQVLPLGAELATVPGFTADPVGDGEATLRPGLLQKYRTRVLMVTTGACAVHCRYCFRRHFPYTQAPHSPDQWQPAIQAIAADESIQEVILSGGDPLTLVDSHLAELARRLAAVPHVRRLRVHTRLPIMIPQRVTTELISWLRGTRLTPIVVIHANHAAELGDDVAAALARLSDAGVPLLNQAVLLAGVNDNLSALVELSERLVELRVMPYYLHQLDRVAGAAHFEVPESVGLDLVAAMRKQLPGYAVPRYVREVAGGEAKEEVVNNEL
jgi:L-lysine 2,3-aminomutase